MYVQIPAERLCAWHGVKQRQQSTKMRCRIVGAIHVVVTAVACRTTRRVQNEYAQQRFSKTNV